MRFSPRPALPGRSIYLKTKPKAIASNRAISPIQGTVFHVGAPHPRGYPVLHPVMSGSSDDEHEARRPAASDAGETDNVLDDSNRPPSSPAAESALGATSSSAKSNFSAMNQELPFLVTHWLANFASATAGQAPPAGGAQVGGPAGAPAPPSAVVSSTGVTAEEREEALRRLQRAAGDVASAFAVLGIFGSATAVSA